MFDLRQHTQHLERVRATLQDKKDMGHASQRDLEELAVVEAELAQIETKPRGRR